MVPFIIIRHLIYIALRRLCFVVLPLCLIAFALFSCFSQWASDSSKEALFAPLRDVSQCFPANVSVGVTTSIINTILKIAVVPAIVNPSNVLVIPPQVKEHVSVDAMTLQHFKMDGMSIATGTPQAQSMTFNATGFGLEVNKTRFFFDYLGIKCNGTFWATLNSTNVDAALLFTMLPAGYWNANFTAIKFDWGALDVQHELESTMCKLAQDVVEIFIGQLDAYIAAQVQKKLDEDAPAQFTALLNDWFANASIHAITPPFMTAEGIVMTLDANPVPFGCAPAPISDLVPQILPRDFAGRTTVTSINNLLQNALAADYLQYTDDLPQDLNTSLFKDVIPSVWEACPDCGLTVAAKLNTAPLIAVPEAASLSVSLTNSTVGVFVRPNTAPEVEALRALIKKRGGAVEADEDFVLRRVPFARLWRAPERQALVPILALNVGASVTVDHFAASTGRAVTYEVLPLEKLTVSVEVSNIGYINTTEIVNLGTAVCDDFMIPLMNARSPVKLPFFLSDAVLDLEPSDLQAGFSLAKVDVPRESPF